MTRPLQISVIGKGTPDPRAEELASEVGELLARSGAVVVCGGLGGVMAAASRAAASAGGTVIGIVPSTDAADANPCCTHVIATGVGHARNLAVVSSGEAVIAVGGEWGTLSEIAFARALGRTVVALGSWTVSGPGAMEAGPGIEVASDPQAAVGSALRAAEQAR